MSQKCKLFSTMTYLGDDDGVGVGDNVGSTIVGICGVTSPAGVTC